MTGEEIAKLVAELRKQGVQTFEGEGLKVEFGPPSPPPAAHTPSDPTIPPGVDPDLFAHETR